MARLRRVVEKKCVACDLHRTATANKIPGRGSDKPFIMFVGQAPGYEEDVKGKCFVGPAGRLLTDAIEEFKIDEYAYRFENTVRCFPPNDKRPTIKQIKACFEYLSIAIEIYKPEIIVPLGSIAFYALTGIKTIGEFSGTLFEIEGEDGNLRIFPVLHPSAVLHNERQLGEFESQMGTLKKTADFIYHGSKEEKANIIIADDKNLSRLRRSLKGNSYSVLDLETSGGLDPLMPDTKIRSIGLCVDTSQYSRDSEAYGFQFDQLSAKRQLEVKNLLKEAKWLISHNGKYEMKWCITKFGFEPDIVEDTAIICHLLNENHKVALDIVGPLYTGKMNHKGSFHYYMYKHGYNWGTVPVNKLTEYCCQDTTMEMNLWKKTIGELDKRNLIKLYEKIEIPTMRTLARMELRGMKVNKHIARQVISQGTKRLTEIRRKIERHPEVSSGMLKNNIKELNLNSAPQVNMLFYNWWKFNKKLVGKTKSGAASTDQNAIEILAGEYPIINLIKEYRGISHGISDIKVILEKCREGDFVSCDFNQTYVVTGRLSSSNPNLQNLPNPKEIKDGERSMVFGDSVKKIFISRFGNNGCIMNVDYKQLELCLAANETGDPVYIRALNAGDDLHALTASKIFPQWTRVNSKKQKEYRFIAKRVNFGVFYNIGAGELAKELKKPKAECKDYLGAYYKTYSMVEKYKESLWDFCREYGYVKSKFGRRRYLPDINSADWWTAKRAMNQACNFPIANMGAELTKWSMSQIDQTLIKRGYKSMVICQVHDSIILDCHKSEIRRVSRLVENTMTEKAMKEWPFFNKVPLKVDISTGPNWLEQEEL